MAAKLSEIPQDERWLVKQSPDGYIVERIDGGAALPGYFTSPLMASKARDQFLNTNKAMNNFLPRKKRDEQVE